MQIRDDKLSEYDNKEIISSIEGDRLDVCLTKELKDYARNYVKKLIDEGLVSVNGYPKKANYIVKSGDIISVYIPKPKELELIPEQIHLDVVYEDEDIIIINKPRGMVVHPGCGNYSGTLVNALLSYCDDSLSDINGVIRPGIVHRIDKDTTGIIVVAKNNKAHEMLSQKFKKHDIKREYHALVEGIIEENTGKIDAPIGRHPVDRKKMAVNVKNGRRAVTYFKVLERFRDATYIELTLETGRTHQIRVHMAYIGHPVIGDQTYGRKKQRYKIAGQALHAKILGFLHPTKGEFMEFSSDLPSDFKDILEQLRKDKMSINE